jgi:hypothetical protein
MDLSIMSQLKITKVAFHDLKIYCNEHRLSDDVLSESDTFLPILLLLVEKAIGDKALMEEIVTYDLVYQKESLLYIKAMNVFIKDKDVLINIITEIKGVAPITHLFDLHDNDPKKYDIKRLCEYVRKKLGEQEDGETLDNFEFLFNHIKTASLSNTFAKILENMKCNE